MTMGIKLASRQYAKRLERKDVEKPWPDGYLPSGVYVDGDTGKAVPAGQLAAYEKALGLSPFAASTQRAKDRKRDAAFKKEGARVVGTMFGALFHYLVISKPKTKFAAACNVFVCHVNAENKREALKIAEQHDRLHFALTDSGDLRYCKPYAELAGSITTIII